MIRWRLLAACAIALASYPLLLLAGCGFDADPTPAPQATISSARATVIAFYKAHAEGREADAYALHSRLQSPSLTLDQYVRKTRWRRDLQLQEVGPAEALPPADGPEYYERLYDLRQVRVEFYQAHDAAARKSGQATEFLTVARETPEGPWRIIEIGTG